MDERYSQIYYSKKDLLNNYWLGDTDRQKSRIIVSKVLIFL